MCPLCKNTPNPHPDQKCAFKEDGSFNPKNWRCESLTKLLEDRRTETVYGNDFSVDVITHPEDGKAIILTRYKRRGRTSQACLIGDDDPPKELTLQDIQEFLQA